MTERRPVQQEEKLSETESGRETGGQSERGEPDSGSLPGRQKRCQGRKCGYGRDRKGTARGERGKDKDVKERLTGKKKREREMDFF